MTARIRWLLPIPLACLLALALPAVADARVRNVTDPDAPRSLPVDGHVDVRWTDPAQFSDIRHSGNRWQASRGNWVVQLAEHLRESAAKRLPAGQTLEVEITDIRRAGMYEPWQGIRLQDVRILRDHYPPRMELRFRLLGEDGSVLAQGERALVDAGFLMRSSSFGDSDPLRYEKAMVDRWLREEFEDEPRLAGAS